MQRIIDSIIRKKNVLIYFLLLSFSLSLVFQTNFFQKSKIIVFSNSTANYFNEMFNNLNGYFDLRRVNSELVNENLFLKNQLENVINKKQLDSLDNAIFKYQNAKVISNSFSSFKNYLIIDKGLKHGLENEMGIISSKGIVGIINYTTKNYSSVMSVLNIDTKINAKVKRTSHFGTLEWNGLSSKSLLLNDIPETAEIKVGDSIITVSYTHLRAHET